MENKIVSLWDLFSADYTKNCLAWQHAQSNPVIPARPGSRGWKRHWTANPDFFHFKGRQLLYYRGNGYSAANPAERHDRIGVAQVHPVPGGYSFEDLNGGEFSIDTGAAGEFDCRDVLDPAAVEFKGQVYLYYSAVGSGADAVGLAVSEDGVHFHKMGKIMDGRAPDMILQDGRLRMIYQKHTGAGYVGFYLAQSEDGLHFSPVSTEPVFQASAKGGWDCQLATARLFQQGPYVYLLYGGHPSLVDQPAYFGLARSLDMLQWERHPGNPIFGCGAKGQEDGGAIWFPALMAAGDGYTLLYEGSRGDYSWDLSSQICMATISFSNKAFDRRRDYSSD